MGYLVCEKCGGYYELQDGESPNDFSDKCECGGNLVYSESLKSTEKDSKNKNSSEATNTTQSPNKESSKNKQKKETKLGMGILSICCIGIILVVVMGGSLFSDKANSIKTNSYGLTTFENQYITFNSNKGLEVVDGLNTQDASSNITDVFIKDNGNLIGEVTITSYNPDDLANMEQTSQYTKTTIAGHTVLEYSDSSGVGAYVILEGNKWITLDFDPAYSSEYTTVKNSLTIKKTPT
jgi:hypothetical protein